MREYKIEETLPGRYAVTYEEDGRLWSIPIDESNADYQRYLEETNGGLPTPAKEEE